MKTFCAIMLAIFCIVGTVSTFMYVSILLGFKITLVLSIVAGVWTVVVLNALIAGIRGKLF